MFSKVNPLKWKEGWRTTISFQWGKLNHFSYVTLYLPCHTLTWDTRSLQVSVTHKLWLLHSGPNSGHRELPSVELVPRYLKEKDYVGVIVHPPVQLYFTKTCVLVVSSLWAFAIGNTTTGVVYRRFQLLCWSHQSWQMEDVFYHSCQRATDDCVKYF